jgi:hypothetical protein
MRGRFPLGNQIAEPVGAERIEMIEEIQAFDDVGLAVPVLTDQDIDAVGKAHP